MLNFDLFKSKSIWGVLGMVIAFLAQPSVLSFLPAKVSAIVIAVAGLWAAIGFRDAIAKNGSGE